MSLSNETATGNFDIHANDSPLQMRFKAEMSPNMNLNVPNGSE